MLEDWQANRQPKPVAVFNLEFFCERSVLTILAPRLARWRTLAVRGEWHSIFISHTPADVAAWPLLQAQGCVTEHLAFADLTVEELKVCARLAVVWWAPRLVPLLPIPTLYPPYLPLEETWYILETFGQEADHSLVSYRNLYAYA